MKDYLCPSGALFVSRCLIYKVHAAGATVFQVYHSSSCLSSTFLFLSKLFCTFIRSGRPRRTRLYYHFFFALSRTFFAFWATFVARVSLSAPPFRSSLHTIPLPSPIVNPLFPIFRLFIFLPQTRKKKLVFSPFCMVAEMGKICYLILEHPLTI